MFKTIVLMGLMACAGRASIITYTFTTTATGYLDGTAFNNALLTITASANSATPGEPFSSTVRVGTLSDTFNSQIPYVFVNPNCGPTTGSPCAGFGTPQGGDMVDIVNSAFSSYVLGNPVGPLNGPNLIGSAAFTPPFPWPDDSRGSLVVTSAGNGSFQASVSQVPEPSDLVLASAGLGGMIGIRRLRRRWATRSRSRRAFGI